MRTTSKEKKIEASRDREEENDEPIQLVMNIEAKLESYSWYSTEDIEIMKAKLNIRQRVGMEVIR